MPRLEKTIEAVFADRDIMPDECRSLTCIWIRC